MKNKVGKTLKNLLYGAGIFTAGLVSTGCEKDVPEPIDNTPPKISIYSPSNGGTYDSKVSLDYAVAEENFKNAWYSINDGAKMSLPQSGTKDLSLGNGDYKIVVGAEDETGNASKDSTYFNVNGQPVVKDTIAPELDVSSPLEDKVYDSNIIHFQGNATDENLSEVNYTLNGGASVSLPESWSSDLDLADGNYKLIVKAKDKSGNVSADTTNFKVEKKTWKYKVNPFVQPNDSTLNWYGSGDVNNDNKVDANDVSKIESIINGSIVPNLNSSDPAEYRTLDRADVNGDGVVNSSDKTMLNDKINGVRDYLPGEWNKIKTKTERENWLNKMLVIDKTNEIKYIPGDYVCKDFARQTMLNFNGFGELGYSKSKGLKDNGRFNIPMNYVSVAIPGSDAHAINMTVTGDKFNEFSSGYWSEPQNDQKVIPGMWDMPNGSEVGVNYSYVKENEVQGAYLSSIPVLKFKDGNLNWTTDNSDLKLVMNR